jgi:molybdate transport system substrate-binding protein
LTRTDVRRVAIANPDHAPFGRAARDALQRAHLWGAVTNRPVLANNFAQTVQWVQSGAADVGLVALSLVSAPQLQGVGRWWLVPEEAHAPLEQAAVLTIRGAGNPAARRYLEFLRGREARRIFERFGFRLPAVDAE